ncbi:hypothetical protein ABMA28_004001 [Loxostege sticticalis]|uniref:RNase H type-1 domain-containing protein n=1 Tax=Loxostege sticticalis TaxID=481309 RepID=A0ABD0SY76_LOXSC
MVLQRDECYLRKTQDQRLISQSVPPTLRPYAHGHSLEDRYSIFVEALMSSADASIPLKKRNSKSTGSPPCHMDYGSFLLQPCNKEGLNSLDRLQAKGLRIVLGAMKSSPKNAMQVEAVDPPLDFRRQYLSDRFIFKVNQCLNHPLIFRLQNLSDLISNSSNKYWAHKETPKIIQSFRKLSSLSHPIAQFRANPLFDVPYDALIFEPSVILDFGISKNDPTAEYVFSDRLNSEWQGWLPVFTDASKTSDASAVGSAVWIPKFRVLLSSNSPQESSVFTGEAVAILEAVSFILSHKLNKSIVFSDSKSTLLAVSTNFFRAKFIHPVILDIKKQLFECARQGIEVVLIWIPGHSGIQGNEQADLWAKRAIQSGSPRRDIFVSDILPRATKDLAVSWQESWDQSSLIKGRHYKSLQNTIPVRPWFFRHKDSTKLAVSVICRLRLGHVCTPVFLQKLHIKDSSLCECSQDFLSPSSGLMVRAPDAESVIAGSSPAKDKCLRVKRRFSNLSHRCLIGYYIPI